MIGTRVILDSVSPFGNRLTTLEVTMPRIILAEFNTHAALAKNSASSRAIPFAVTSRRVEEDPFVPVVWPRNQAGMQGGANIEGVGPLIDEWLFARNDALRHAAKLSEMGVHKSLVNRLIEPFSWHVALVTAMEWENFFTQRDSDAAEAHMHMLAHSMREALDASTPTLLRVGQWHMPFIKDEDRAIDLDQREVSAARCARVSYTKHDGTRDIAEDVRLAGQLRDDQHWSPFEHVATPARLDEMPRGKFSIWRDGDHMPSMGGWHQLRHWRGA